MAPYDKPYFSKKNGKKNGEEELFDHSGLTSQENEVMAHLVAAWSEFNRLSRLSPDHLTDFRRAIHECQRILATRVVKRDYPDYWAEGAHPAD